MLYKIVRKNTHCDKVLKCENSDDLFEQTGHGRLISIGNKSSWKVRKINMLPILPSLSTCL